MTFNPIVTVLYGDDYVQLASHFINCFHNCLCLIGEYLSVGPLA